MLLEGMGLVFDTVVPSVHDEDALLDTADLTGSLQVLARAKASSVAVNRPDALVLGCDTIVVVDGQVLGKPRDDDDARDMLRMLSGRTHQVMSGVALQCGSEEFSVSATVVTDVTFRELSDADIDWYLRMDQHRDKAGAYGIQEAAMVFVTRVCGCYYNVVGLPVTTTITLLESYLNRGSSEHV